MSPGLKSDCLLMALTRTSKSAHELQLSITNHQDSFGELFLIVKKLIQISGLELQSKIFQICYLSLNWH